MDNLNYLLEDLLFISSFQDLMYSTLFYILWILTSILFLLMLGIRAALISLVLIPAILLIVFPETMDLVLGKSIYFLLFGLLLMKLLLIPFNADSDNNCNLEIGRAS
ncbi:hypothetical protein JCM30760_19690 [Thiomicrorhabdus hydrogeniphila]